MKSLTETDSEKEWVSHADVDGYYPPEEDDEKNQDTFSEEIQSLLSEPEELSFLEETWFITKLAVPSILTNVLTGSMSLVDLMMVGHLGTDELAAAALGNTYFNFFFSFMVGVSFSMEALGSQAYGARDFYHLNKLFRQAAVVCSFFLLVASGALSISGFVCKHVLMQNDNISSMMEEFDLLLIPGLWTFAFYQLLTKYLQVQNVMKPPMIINFFGNLLNASLSYYLIYIYDLGFIGAPIATTISRTVMFISITIFILFIQREIPPTQPPSDNASSTSGSSLSASGSSITSSMDSSLSVSLNSSVSRLDDEETALLKGSINDEKDDLVSSTGNKKESKKRKRRRRRDNEREEKLFNISWYAMKQFSDFRGMFKLSKIAIQGGMMTSSEDLSFEVTTFEAGYLTTTALAAHQICLVLITVTFLAFPLGLSVAGGIRVGNLLGADLPQQAKKASKVLLMMCVFMMGLLITGYIFSKDIIGYAFSSDEDVVEQVSRLVYIICIFQFFDGFQGCCQGIMRGLARLSTVGKTNFVSLWLVGIPTGIIIAFVLDWGVSGLWWGFVVGLIVEFLIYTYILVRIDWEEEADRALNALEHLTNDQPPPPVPPPTPLDSSMSSSNKLNRLEIIEEEVFPPISSTRPPIRSPRSVGSNSSTSSLGRQVTSPIVSPRTPASRSYQGYTLATNEVNDDDEYDD